VVLNASHHSPLLPLEHTMYPILPGDLLANGWEFLCCGLTAVIAVVSYVLTWR